MTEGSFKGVDGIKIFTREWQPASKPRTSTSPAMVLRRGGRSPRSLFWNRSPLIERLDPPGIGSMVEVDSSGRGSSDRSPSLARAAGWTSAAPGSADPAPRVPLVWSVPRSSRPLFVRD